MRVPLRMIAHSRSGDKGNTSNVAVIVYRPEFYPLLAEQLTEIRVQRHYEGVVTGPVRRYAVPSLGVLNFVCEGALGGGVSRSLCLDNYGKTLAAAILTMEVEVPAELAGAISEPVSS